MKKEYIIYSFIILCLAIAVIEPIFSMSHNENEIIMGDTNISGDINNDGKVSSLDYIMIRKHLIGIQLLSSNELKKSDINSDGKISSLDYIALRKKIIYGNNEDNHNPIKTNGNIGIWYSTWYAYEDVNSSDNKLNTWKSWDIKYKPLLSSNQFGYYDTMNKHELIFHMASIASIGIDFIILDQTNNIYVDNGYIFKRSVQTAKYLEEFNNQNKDKVYYCSAIGGVQWSLDAKTIENEAKIIWEEFVMQPFGKYHYYYKGKPVLVVYGDRAEEIWNNYNGDKTYGNRFSIFYADNQSTPGYWGWAYDKGIQLNRNSVVVMPGWHNHTGRQVKRDNGRTYKNNWESLINYNYVPEFVIINSFNEYAEATAIWPADTKELPKSKYTDIYDIWYRDDGKTIDPYFYWELTKNYIALLQEKIKDKTP